MWIWFIIILALTCLEFLGITFQCFTMIYSLMKIRETRLSSISLIKSDLKWWIYRIRIPFILHFQSRMREKGGDLTQPCDKNPFTHRTIQKAMWQHKYATKIFDYTTIADRLRTVSWSNSSHPTGVVKPAYERSTLWHKGWKTYIIFNSHVVNIPVKTKYIRLLYFVNIKGDFSLLRYTIATLD